MKWHPCGLDVVQHRVAQYFQFRVLDLIEFDPELEDGDRHQLRSIPVAAPREGFLAILEGRQHLVHRFLRISHQLVFRDANPPAEAALIEPASS
jgi:hypothetical protein